jgi:hypothetical protein
VGAQRHGAATRSLDGRSRGIVAGSGDVARPRCSDRCGKPSAHTGTDHA